MDQNQEASNSFDVLGLDERLVRALEKLKYASPTPVQVECIKAALSGKDIVARAQTGSGKTLAYLLPALQRILSQPPEVARSSWQCVVLVPTRELAEQVAGEARALAGHCGAMLTVSALTAEGEADQHSQLLQAGHLVVATPGRIAQAFAEGRLRQTVFQPDARQRRAGLGSLVLDEADLMLSMPGYDADFAALAPLVPRSCQCMLMSATTSAQVEKLQKLLLHNPETLNLLAAKPSGEATSTATTASGSSQHITHFYIDCSREDRLLVVLVLLKLGLVSSKTLLFVNGAESGYRLRLLLEAFGVRSAVLLADLPLNSRTHILQEFNRGLFDNLIAVDDPRSQGGGGAPAPPPDNLDRRGKSSKKRKQAELEVSGDQEYGVVRGIDFKGVRTVVNVEPPDGVAGYVHRVGRTGRAGKAGTAITLLTPADQPLAAALQPALLPGGAEREGGGLEAGGLKPFSQLERRSLEALRYRGEDILRSLNKQVVREARAKDLRLELLNSERLAAHFEAHPGDLALLRHDKPLAKAAGGSHLKGLPTYLARAAGKATPSSLAPGAKAQMWKKRRKLAAAGDPLKKAAGFAKAPRRGEGASEPLTRMELAAEKHAPKPKKAASFLPKRNVRKGKYRKR